ncbi:hypothetical protein, partial [Sporisorium scitamineum]
DLVSDSDESNSDNEDPDKENDVSLVNATPRLDSDVSLSSFPTQGVQQHLATLGIGYLDYHARLSCVSKTRSHLLQAAPAKGRQRP